MKNYEVLAKCHNLNKFNCSKLAQPLKFCSECTQKKQFPNFELLLRIRENMQIEAVLKLQIQTKTLVS